MIEASYLDEDAIMLKENITIHDINECINLLIFSSECLQFQIIKQNFIKILVNS
jgi:hypothetical protein